MALAMIPAVEVAVQLNKWLSTWDEAGADTILRIGFVIAVLASMVGVGRGVVLECSVVQRWRLAPMIEYMPGFHASLWILILIAVVAGVVGSLLGLGGGLVLVPLFTALLGVPMKQAVATSSLAIACAAWYAGISYGAKGRWMAVAGLAAGAAALLGA